VTAISNQDATAKKGFNANARRQARTYALQALYQWQIADHALNEVEAQFRAQFDFANADLAYFHELLHEIPAHLSDVQNSFIPHLDRKLDDLDPIELSVLRIGCYELLKRIDVPYKVAINESVNLAKKFGATDGHKYINGILDKVAHEVRAVEISGSRNR
jgi:N utilization substance protein B